MKKRALLIVCVLACVLLLCGCGLVKGLADAQSEVDKLPIAECVQALADGNKDAFTAYLHPDVQAEAADSGYQAMARYIAGGKVKSVQAGAFNVSSGVGTNGNTKVITAKYLVTFEQGGSILVDLIYEENKNGTGFTQFLCEMGIAK